MSVQCVRVLWCLLFLGGCVGGVEPEPPAPSAQQAAALVPRYSETYTFRTDTNDGVRLWVDGQLLIDDWREHPATVTNRGTLTLEAGRAYSLRMEFFEARGWASARLLWSSPSQALEIIPESQPRPTSPPGR